jgi:hypothetical protein
MRVDLSCARLRGALNEVGKRVLELVHEFYEVGIHCLRSWLNLYWADVVGGRRGKVVVSQTARVAWRMNR